MLCVLKLDVYLAIIGTHWWTLDWHTFQAFVSPRFLNNQSTWMSNIRWPVSIIFNKAFLVLDYADCLLSCQLLIDEVFRVEIPTAPKCQINHVRARVSPKTYCHGLRRF